MTELRYTLHSDGSSNQSLIPIITWLLREHLRETAIQSEWADLRRLPNPPSKMSERIKSSIDLYPCDLLFVHRDAENEPVDNRLTEIHEAVEGAMEDVEIPPTVCVVPIRMMEAWLLFDINAIRRAAGNPNGRQSLNLPNLNDLERLPDPKKDLHRILRIASGLPGRRLSSFNERSAVHRVPEYIEDFSPLRTLSAFQSLEDQIIQTISS